MRLGEIGPGRQEISGTAAEPPAHVSPTQAPVNSGIACSVEC